MKRSVIFVFLLVNSILCSGQNNDSLLVMFWNLENFFDYKDGGAGDSDKEFSSFGTRRWTKGRFQAKCNAVSKSIYRISDIYGKLPDIIGLAEIENRNVLYRLINDTALKKAGYSFIHFDGLDRRGIDVALMYRKSVMKPLSVTRRIPVTENGDTLMSRDILHVRMKTGHSSLDFIVNHHPSKFGGERVSEGRRAAAMTCLCNMCDSLLNYPTSEYSGIVAMGDFNDTPDSPPFRLIEGLMVNKGVQLHDQGRGTIRYEGKWELIDMFLVSASLADISVMEVVNIPFLMVKDNVHAGLKPLRTYSGPKYLGGVSDHCPILLLIN